MKKTFTICFLSTLALSCFAYGCGDDDDDPPANVGGSAGSGQQGGGGNGGGTGGANGALTSAEERQLILGMHGAVATNVTALKDASTELCAAAPAAAAGWEAAVPAMKAAWVKTRDAYERIEGVVAPLFPDTDAAIDERYDGFIEELGDAGDQNLFDDQGVTGMHAIERILYKDNAADVLLNEAQAVGAGYKAPAYPANDAEAADFKGKLCQKLVADTTDLEAQWAGLIGAGDALSFDLDAAYTGLLGLVAEQQEKVVNASTQLDESRYSKRTMADLRANLEGVKAAYALVSPLLVKRANPADPEHAGPALDMKIKAGLANLEAAYAQVQGDDIPEAPEGWSQNPTAEQLATPFGKLYTAVSQAVDPAVEGSISHEMEDAAEVLGITIQSEG